MLIIRLLLGVGEAAFSPGVPFYLSFFYRRDELALRAAIQISAAPLASSFAGSLAYLITWLGARSPIASWRVLFLVEGFPSIIAAIVAWSFVADGPEFAWFLTQRERNIARLRLRREGGAKQEHDEKEAESTSVISHSMDWRGVAQTLTDPKAYLTAVSLPLPSSRHISPFTPANSIPHTAHVPLLQYRLLLPPRLPPHNPNLNGLHAPDLASPLRPTLYLRHPPSPHHRLPLRSVPIPLTLRPCARSPRQRILRPDSLGRPPPLARPGTLCAGVSGCSEFLQRHCHHHCVDDE